MLHVAKQHTAVQNPGNPNERNLPYALPRLLYAMLAFALAGLAISGYLTYTHFNEAALVCSIGGCETVQESSYSTIGPLPVALLGVGMFAALLTLAGLRLFRPALRSAEHVSILAWAMLLAGILYYVYLTYVELFILEAICQWCVASSIAAVALFALESVYFWRTVMADEHVDAG